MRELIHRLQLVKVALAVAATALYYLMGIQDKKVLAFCLLPGIIIDFLLLFFRLKQNTVISSDPKEVNKANLFDLVFSLACYNLAIKIFPEVDNQISLFFWVSVFAELGLNFWFIRKFRKMNLNTNLGLRIFNMVINLAFVLLFFGLNYQLLFSVAFILGFIAYVDFALLIHWMPFYSEQVHFSWQAFKQKKEYEKYLK